MKPTRLFALALAACCLVPAAHAATGAAAQAPAREQQLIGIWQDDHDPENIIQFFPNHAVRIYVPKDDGQADNTHWVDGSWALAGRELTLTLNTPGGGMSRVKKFTVAFTRGAMVVKARGKVVGRQHRITGQALQKHLW
jgi:hypothetical protein